MAQIVLGIGTSHSPMLNSPAEDFEEHARVDAAGRRLFDREGTLRSYVELVEMAPPNLVNELTDEVKNERALRCQMDVERVAESLAQARLDALIVVGDDQHEQYADDNMPAILVYWGDTIENSTSDVPAEAPKFWRTARSQYHEEHGQRAYPVQAELARHVIEHLMDSDFDVSQSRQLGKPRGEGHAFGFVHRRLMLGGVVPIVPIAINTYFSPNQPRPSRCLELGKRIREAVASWPGDARVGILASGGLSHFTVDEDLDRLVMKSIIDHDDVVLRSLPLQKLNSGSSEIRNWIVMAGACTHLSLHWSDYVPCYRSLAGTGCGMGFLVLSD